MDSKAKKILLGTYWEGGGLKRAYSTEPDAFAYAKAKGLMFDPASMDHDRCVDEVFAIHARIPPLKPARAFLSSLGGRRPDWRSGLVSYLLAGRLSRHAYRPVMSGNSYGPGGEIVHTSYRCGACGHFYGSPDRYEDVDLNVLNFERIKWGGVRHG
jgi:hypothetical protein